MLHQPSYCLDSVELWTVRREGLKIDALLLQECESGLDASGPMVRSVVENNHKRFVELAAQILHKTQEGLGDTALPVVSACDSVTAEPRGHDIEASTARSDTFVRWKPIEEQPIDCNPDLNNGIRLPIFQK